jgi:hypothetical protein
MKAESPTKQQLQNTQVLTDLGIKKFPAFKLCAVLEVLAHV